jgi:hypothetical protein
MTRPVPYITTKAGIRIGSAYQRPLPRIEGDAMRLQTALIDPARRVPEPLRLVAALVWRIL